VVSRREGAEGERRSNRKKNEVVIRGNGKKINNSYTKIQGKKKTKDNLGEKENSVMMRRSILKKKKRSINVSRGWEKNQQTKKNWLIMEERMELVGACVNGEKGG